MISNQGLNETEQARTPHPDIEIIERECGLRSVAYCYICERHICSMHRLTRHWGEHPPVYPA
jgi:hypothetical protein